jgi:hypothetical protein
MGLRKHSLLAEGVLNPGCRVLLTVGVFLAMCSCAESDPNKRGFIKKDAGKSADTAAVAQSSALEPAAGGVPAPPAAENGAKQEPLAPEKVGSGSGGPADPATPGVANTTNTTNTTPSQTRAEDCVAGAQGTDFGRVNAAAGVNVRAKALLDSDRIGGFDDKTKISIWKSFGTAPSAWLCVSGQDHLGAAITGWVNATLIERVTEVSAK